MVAWVVSAVMLLAACNKPGQASAPPPASSGGTPAAPAPTTPTAVTPATSPAPATAATPAAEPEVIFHSNRAQTNLPIVKLLIGPHELDAELCTTITQVATGMMHRKGVGTNDAMFFVFAIGQQRSFYMKNVDFPIAAAYIDTDGVVQEIVQLKAREVTPVPSKSERIQYVLETAPDWFTRNNVGVGALVTTPKGELRTTLARLARLP
jgi:uncharacterized membrane protein (UPF0127 family)